MDNDFFNIQPYRRYTDLLNDMAVIPFHTH